MPVAIVTGGNSGIGRACAVALARKGFDVGLTWHEDEENLREVVSELEGHGVRVAHRQADFERVPGADAMIDELAEELGRLDALSPTRPRATARPTWRPTSRRSSACSG